MATCYERRMRDLDQTDAAALTAVLNALANPEVILKVWHAKELFANVGEDGVRVSLGQASSPSVPIVCERYQRSVGRSFPRLLSAFLSTHDGLNVETTSDGRIAVVGDADLHVTNGLLPAEHLESDETSDFACSGLLFAKAYDQSRLILVEEGERCGAILFDDGESPVVIAASLAEFFRQLVDHGMSVEAIASERI
jgi:hypothetical protein